MVIGCLLVTGMLALTGCGAPAAADANASVPMKKVADIPAPDKIDPATKVAQPQEGYATLTNLEMVEYCLPYPVDFKEDYDAAEEKGQHVFVSKDKKIKIFYAGNPYDDEFIILYHDAQAEVQDEIMADPMLDESGEDWFKIVWEKDKKTFWLHKWYRADAKETVTVRFEYATSEAERIKPAIQYITAASSHCE